jgi:hypothetical protein
MIMKFFKWWHRRKILAIRSSTRRAPLPLAELREHIESTGGWAYPYVPTWRDMWERLRLALYLRRRIMKHPRSRMEKIGPRHYREIDSPSDDVLSLPDENFWKRQEVGLFAKEPPNE